MVELRDYDGPAAADDSWVPDRESSKVAEKTAEAISGCTALKVLNLNYTNVSPSYVVPILRNCLDLEVLKLAALPKLVSTASTGPAYTS